MLFSIHEDLTRSQKHVSRLDKQDTEHPQLSRVLPGPTNRQTESNFGTDLSSGQIRPDCGPKLNWAAELREALFIKSHNNLANTEHWNSLAFITGHNTMLNLQHKHICVHTDLNQIYFLNLLAKFNI